MRKATNSDGAALAALHAACLPQSWAEQDFREWSERPNYTCLIAEEENARAPLAYIMARRISPEAEIIALAVDEAQRRHGIGRRLMETLIGTLAAEGVTRLFLEVSVKNNSARAFYDAMEFREVGRRAGYYADGSDALLLAKVVGSG